MILCHLHIQQIEKKYIAESESDSVVITGEVKKPTAKSNALEEHLQASPVYSLDWLKSLLVLYYWLTLRLTLILNFSVTDKLELTSYQTHVCCWVHKYRPHYICGIGYIQASENGILCLFHIWLRIIFKVWLLLFEFIQTLVICYRFILYEYCDGNMVESNRKSLKLLLYN